MGYDRKILNRDFIISQKVYLVEKLWIGLGTLYGKMREMVYLPTKKQTKKNKTF